MTVAIDYVEQKLIGSILQKPSRIEECLETLKTEHLNSSKSRLVFKCMVDLYDMGRAISIDNISLLIEDALPEKPAAKDNAVDFLMTCIETTPESINITESSVWIREQYNKRETRRAIEDVKKALNQNELSTDQVLEKVEEIRESLAVDDTLPGQSAYDLILAYLQKIERLKNGEEALPRLTTGFNSLDRILGGGMYKGGTTVVSGRPSMGKTSFAMQMILNLALQGEKVLAISTEMSREQLAGRTLFSMSKVTEDQCIHDGATEAQWEHMQRQVELLSKTKDTFFIDDTSLTPDKIISSIMRFNRQMGVNVVMVDYAQNVVLEQNTHQDLANFVKKLTMIGRDNDITIILVSQLKRELENRADKRPLMSDHSDTKKLEEVASHMITLYRDEVYNPDTEDKGIAEVSVIKNRWGGCGTTELKFVRQHTYFTDPLPSGVASSLSRSNP